jgi:hypothetical protein
VQSSALAMLAESERLAREGLLLLLVWETATMEVETFVRREELLLWVRAMATPWR